MILKTMAWRPESGWSSPWPADMDSPSTFAVMFGGGTASECRAAIAEVAARLPQATLTGCSTAGEILADHVQDASLAVAIARFDAVTLRAASLPVDPGADAFAIGRALGLALAELAPLPDVDTLDDLRREWWRLRALWVADRGLLEALAPFVSSS